MGISDSFFGSFAVTAYSDFSTKKLLGKEMNTASIVIITSAIHMKRSASAFQAEVIYPDCYITDTWVDVKGQSVSFMPSVGTLVQWPELLHKWIGYIMYKLKGW